MLLTEVEAPASEYRGARWASYFGFLQKDVFAWTFEVGSEEYRGVEATAAIAGGKAYVAGLDGKLGALRDGDNAIQTASYCKSHERSLERFIGIGIGGAVCHP